jgi:uncharacterized membrane protein
MAYRKILTPVSLCRFALGAVAVFLVSTECRAQVTAPVVSAVSTTPNSGTGLSQTFALHYSDTAGATDLATAWVWFNPALTFSNGGSSCLLYYVRATNQVNLYNDAGTGSLTGTLGTGTLSNSQCSMNLASATASASGNDLILSLPITFTGAYLGTMKNIFMYAAGSNANSGWQTMGSWTIPAAVVVSAVSATPNSGSGAAQTFALHYSDTAGATDVATAWVWFNPALTFSNGGSSCLLYYVRATNQVNLYNDAGTGVVTGALGTAGTLSNSQCSVNLGSATASAKGNDLILSLPVTFSAGYVGTKNIYMYAAGSSASSAWQSMGSWTIPAMPAAAGDPPITADWPFQARYSANLTLGESYIDITNTGANGAPLLGPGFGGASGNICVNVYAFDPGEELISCCSCLVTPDQTVNLGVNRDLTVQTLTGVIPTSVTVKLLATLAGVGGTGTSCAQTAATVGSATIVSGMAAWGTTLHTTSVAGTFATTETAFTPSSLSAAELSSIGGRCAFILGNGGGFGICSSCRSGALGGSKVSQ